MYLQEVLKNERTTNCTLVKNMANVVKLIEDLLMEFISRYGDKLKAGQMIRNIVF